MTQEEFFKRYTYSIRTDKIGGGAFGTVYKAYDNILNREVAIKVSEVKTIGDKEFSLKDEFNAIKDLPVHPNIANYEELYTYEMPNGIFDYAVMQFYKDGNLSAAIKQNLTSEQKEQIALDLLQGIIHLHKHKVVHRDLKPSNILVAKRGDKIIPIITDFGLSKQTKQEAQSQFSNSFGGGTLKYSSPEQLKGNKLRLNTDLWAYGVIVYEIFTAQTLFNANTATGVSAEAEKEIYEQILNLNFASQIKQLPEKWQNILELCLVRDADKRIKSAEELEGIILNKENTIVEQKNQNSINKDKTKVESNSPIEKKTVSSDNLKSSDEYNKPADKTIIEKPVTSDKLPESLELSGSSSDSPKPKKKNKLLIPIISFATVAIIVALFFILSPSEQADWQTAQEQNTIESYQQYLADYPQGEHIAQAEENIAWQNAEQENNIETYKQYALDYPWGEYITEANEQIDYLNKKEQSSADVNAYENAKRQNTVESYQQYILNYPHGIYVNKAKEAVNNIKSTPSIGQYAHGGVIFYIDETGKHGLVCAIKDQGNGKVKWSCSPEDFKGANRNYIGGGKQNTIDIINGCSEKGIPARLCTDLNLNGFSDWFLPSKGELNEIYKNRNVINETSIANGGKKLKDWPWYESSSRSDSYSYWKVMFGNKGYNFGGQTRSDIGRVCRAIRVF